VLGCVCAPLLAPVQAAFAVTVSAGSISSVEGAPFSGQVATFSDFAVLGCPAGSSYKSSVAWSDDSTSSTATIGTPTQNGFSCTYPVSAAHRFVAVGGQHFTVAVSGSSGSDSATGSAAISAAPLNSLPQQIAAVEGAPFTAAVAIFTDGFTGRPASHYTASVDWGDGATTAAATIIPAADGSFVVDASHTYANVGSYATTVGISDPEGSHTTAASATTVSDAPLTSAGVANTAIEDQGLTATVARFTDADPGRPASHYSASVNWGDGSGTSAATVSADPGGGYDVNASHTFANPGSYTTTVAISDPDGSQTTAVAQTSVADAPLSSAGIAINAVAGQAFPANLAVFTDADAGRPASHYSASVSWGDGSTTAAPTITADPVGGYEVSSSHTYAKAGSYTITVTIADAGGSRAVATSTATVTSPPPPPPPPPAPTTGTTTAAASVSTKPASTTPPKPAVPAILATPKVGLTSPRLSPSRTSIAIDVTCPTGGASCQGVVRLTTLPASGSKIAALRRGATIGSVLFVLHPNQTRTFSVHIAAKTLQLLREAGTARVQGVAVAFGQTGNSTSSGAIAKIAAVKAAKPKSKSK
jgi:PKD repeat protein